MKIVVLNEEENQRKLQNEQGDISRKNSLMPTDAVAANRERKISLDPSHILQGKRSTNRRASSISSLGNWTGAVIVSEVAKLDSKSPWQAQYANLSIYLIYL